MQKYNIKFKQKQYYLYARKDKIFHELNQQFLHRDRYTKVLIDIKLSKCNLMDGLKWSY